MQIQRESTWSALSIYTTFYLFFSVTRSYYVKTRKLHFELCALKAHWNVDYLTKLYGKILCLSSNDTVTAKKHNICWHNQTKHSSQCTQLLGKQQILKWSISTHRDFFTKIRNESEATTKVCLWMAHLLVKQSHLLILRSWFLNVVAQRIVSKEDKF